MLEESGESKTAGFQAFPAVPFRQNAPMLLLSHHARRAWRLIGPLVFLLANALPGFAASRPNVLVILTDDQGWGDLSLNGNSNLQTPRIDSLARDGARFDRFYVCPVCSPTRAEFLTGRYHPRGGVYSTSAGGERLDLDERTIADTFHRAGYATGAFGKWHNGMQYPYHPNGRGFEEYYGFCSGHWGDYFSPPLEHNGKIVEGNGFVIDDFTDKAMAFMEKSHREGRPFFCYLPYNTPHSPMQVPDRFWEKFKDHPMPMRNREPGKEDVNHSRAALAMCENIDWNVGRLLDRLDQLGVTQDTIVLYFCDNGPNGVRWNGGMRGRKGSTDEGGTRSPLLMRWPGHIPSGKLIEPISAAIDLLPTLADLAGIPVASTHPLDGISLKPVLLGTASNAPERLIFSHWNNKVSVRNQRFRLDDKGKLYDLLEDPGQDRDVSGQHPDLTRGLRQAVDDWKADLLPGLRDDQRPFIIGHPDFAHTQIPARDGIAHGNIKRSNRFPNCSYFTNWVATSDSITWEVEVAAPGEFEVELHYACPKADLGAELELSFQDAVLRGRVTEAHDVPARGGEHDRVPRVESYVKDFRSMTLGRIRLPAGPGTLTLRANQIPGAQAIEFRLMMLHRIP